MNASLERRQCASILLVDDHPANLLALEVILEPLGQRTVRASSGEEALARLNEEDFSVVLLDVMMPGVDGLHTADIIRSRGRETPIIFMTAGDTPDLAGYARGGVDLLRKPLDATAVRAKVAVFVELFQAREQIREQAARLAEQERNARAMTVALLNASLDGVIGIDCTGCISEFNAAAEEMFGRKRQEVVGHSMADLLVPPHLRDAHRRGLARYLETGESRVLDTRIEVTALRAGGMEFPIELAVRRVAAEGSPTFLAYVRDQSVQRQAEKTRAFLARASEAFAASLDLESTLHTVAGLAVPHVADWCAVEIVGDDLRPIRAAVAHVDPAKVGLAQELRRRYTPDPHATSGVSQVLRSGQSELHRDITAELLERVARDAEHLRILNELGLRSAVIVPIKSRGRTLGAITFIAAESGRHYSQTDLETAEELARRAALAIENARQYQATQLAEERNRFLAEATEALASSLDYTATLRRISRLAVPRIAESAAVYRLEGGTIRLTALTANDPKWEALALELDALLPLRIEQQDRTLPRVIHTGVAELLPDISESLRETWSPTSRADEIVRQLAIRSYMVVPLVVRNQVLGALALTTSATGRRFDPDDFTLAQELARRAGLAIENAQLYREVQDASRLKDEFLATVSHELRTPLTSIMGWLHLLRSGSPAQVARAIDTIERNAKTQARIIDDILDVSRFINGQLRLELERVNLNDILKGAIENVRPAAAARQVEITATLDPDAEAIADPARLQQIAWNLLSNALKFTPEGGRIDVRLQRDGATVTLRFSDTGQGIAADFLPHVFERFRQGDSSATREYGGLGLGLAIVRDLVELHGGRVAAESAGEGRGSVFTVILPVAPAGATAGPVFVTADQTPGSD